MILNKKFIPLLTSILILFCCSVSLGLEKIDPALHKWMRETNIGTKDKTQTVELKVTYYSNEYVQELIRVQAEKNLWTNSEMEDYKYALLKRLNFNEYIGFHVDMFVEGIPIYAQPFDKYVKLTVGKKKYSPADYDKQFNMKISGRRDGMVFFSRYDDKTGKNILEKARDVRLSIDGSIGYAMASKGDVTFVWDITKDRPSENSGAAAARLEIDRLIKRVNKLNADRKKLQDQVDVIDKELNEVNTRIDELQEVN